MVKRVFLIDFENVHSEGLAGVDSLTENDEVVIFHSINADTITFEMMHKLMFSKAKLSYYKVRRGGKNALDFQLSSYLGYLINADGGGDKVDIEFYIISKDSGFDFVIDFWESGNIDVKPKIRRFYTIKAVLAYNKDPKAHTQKRIAPLKAAAPAVTEENPVTEEKPAITEEKSAVLEKKADLPKEKTVITEEKPAVSGKKAALPKEKSVIMEEKPAVLEKKAALPKKKSVVPEEKIVFPEEKPAVSEEKIVFPKEKPAVSEDAAASQDAIVIVESAPEAAKTAEMDIETVAEVDKLLSESKSSHELYIGMVKRFGQKKGVELYRNIKPRFAPQKTG